MQEKKPILFQINDTLKILSGLFGCEITLEELIEFGESKAAQKVRTVESKKIHPAAPKASKRTRKSHPKPLTTPSGRYSKNLKKVRPEAGDVMVHAVWKKKVYTYPGTPDVKDMLDGPITLFLNFTDPVVVRKFKANLRATARVNGFGVKFVHLAYNRVTVELGDINTEHYAKRQKSKA